MQFDLFDPPIAPKSEPTTACGITLRDYQERARAEARRLWADGERGVLIRQPTGTGKTVVGSVLADDWLSAGPRRRVMVLAHERQLVWQFADEIRSLTGRPVGVEMGVSSQPVFGQDEIVVACRASLIERDAGDGEQASRLYKFDPDLEWLLIIDEAHRWRHGLSSCRHIVDWFDQCEGSRRLGLTATPRRGDGVSLSKLFPAVALDYPLFPVDDDTPCAMVDGWAVPYDLRFISLKGVDLRELDSFGGKDFDTDQLDSLLSEKQALAELMEPLIDLAGDRRTIVFVPGVKTARGLANLINAEREYRQVKGEPVTFGEARSLDGGIRERVRRAVYADHQADVFQFLVVCNLCREGYNDPGIGCVAMFRPTKNPALVEQMLGRGCRPLRGLVDGLANAEERRAAIAASAKPNCRVIDLVGASGQIETVTAAHILASGDPDEVVEKVNRAVREEATDDIADVIKQARAEVDAEERERQRLARIEREEAERQHSENLTRLRTEVSYSVETVQHGSGETTTAKPRRHANPPTAKQIAALVRLGYDREVVAGWSKRKAGAVIGRTREHRGKRLSPPTDGQIRVLRKFGRPIPHSYDDAATMIESINFELQRRR